MVRSVATRKRNVECRAKVKTGCATCRIRKVKCDEKKPSCQKCVSTGRICDGYESPFRIFNGEIIQKAHAGGFRAEGGSQIVKPTLAKVAPRDIELLNHYFSVKTLLDVRLGCDEEARHILQASLTDLPIRHAVSSLRALREDLEMSGDGPLAVTQQTPSYNYGLHQYSMALGGLASTLSSPDSGGLKSALLCCQILISIEQVRADYAAMAQHIIRGLTIMHEYRARPSLVAASELVPANQHQLPFLDVFVIKLFAAPCKFAEHPAGANSGRTTVSACPISLDQRAFGSRDLRAIAPDMRAELTRIATSTLEFLGKVSRAESVGHALGLVFEKKSLLESLESWFMDLEIIQSETRPSGLEPLSVSFLRLFHRILKIVLLGSLQSSPHLDAKLQVENHRLQEVANNVGKRVGTYKRWGTGGSQGKQLRVR